MVPCLSVKLLAHNSSQNKQTNKTKILAGLCNRGGWQGRGSQSAKVHMWKWGVSPAISLSRGWWDTECWCEGSRDSRDHSQPRGSHPIKWKWSIHSPGCSSGEDCGCGCEIATGEGFSNYSNNSEWEGLPSSSEMPAVLWPHIQSSYLQSFVSSLSSVHV